MATLGERIRTLRKQKKLTLEALAGKELTKGMLSLIENNKANPSMESLNYIAKQLDVEVSELLEEVNVQELRQVLEQAEKLYYAESEDLDADLIALVKPYVDKLSYGYEAARLLDLYSRSLYYEKKPDWQSYSVRAEKMYDEMNLVEKQANIGIFRATVKFVEHDYERALEILLMERKKIETKYAFLPAITRLDFDYNEAVFYFAIGNTDNAIEVMQRAIDFSKEQRMFYRTDALYRLAVGHGMMSFDKQQAEYYAKKLLQFGEFAEDIEATLFHGFTTAYFYNYDQEYIKALNILDQNLAIMNKENIHLPFYYVEKGKALYGLGKLEEALHSLDKVIVPLHIHHPYDLSFLYVMDSYKALCHVELGNGKEAIRLANIAVKNIAPLPRTPIQDFILKTNEQIKKIAQS